MYSEFAYSHEMQIILMFLSFAFNFTLMYLNAKLIMRIYGEEASVKQKAWFAFLAGCILQSAYVYIVYYIGGAVSFPPVQHLLITSPNPITALLYCYMGIKLLKLSPLRSIELMGHVYLYYTIVNCLNRLAGSVLFIQNAERFNYMLDASRHFLNLGIAFLIYWITWRILDKRPALLVSKESMFARPQRDLIVFVLKACMVYLCVVLIPILVSSALLANALIFFILFLFLLMTLLINLYQHAQADIHNKEAHIHALIKSTNDFRAVKHDFYNILQTFNGFFAINDLEGCKKYHSTLVAVTTQAGTALDISKRMGENPSFISLLLDKHNRAERLDVHMDIHILCDITQFPMSEIDICRVVACLLDNAIEAAAESEQRRVSFTIEQHTNDSKIIIISNSAREPLNITQMYVWGVSSKQGHQGIGLNSARKIIEKYGNCAFQMNHYNNEIMAYVEMGQA